MKRLKKIGALISGLLPILSLSTKTKAMKNYLAPAFYNRNNCPHTHIDKAPDNIVATMINNALIMNPKEHEQALEDYDQKFGMHPCPIQVTGLRA